MASLQWFGYNSFIAVDLLKCFLLFLFDYDYKATLLTMGYTGKYWLDVKDF